MLRLIVRNMPNSPSDLIDLAHWDCQSTNCMNHGTCVLDTVKRRAFCDCSTTTYTGAYCEIGTPLLPHALLVLH